MDGSFVKLFGLRPWATEISCWTSFSIIVRLLIPALPKLHPIPFLELFFLFLTFQIDYFKSKKREFRNIILHFKLVILKDKKVVQETTEKCRKQ